MTAFLIITALILLNGIFVAADRIGTGPWTTGLTADAKVCHQGSEHRGVAGLAGGQQHDQGHAVPVDELVDLGRQPAAGAANRVVRRLREWVGRFRVTRPSPL